MPEGLPDEPAAEMSAPVATPPYPLAPLPRRRLRLFIAWLVIWLIVVAEVWLNAKFAGRMHNVAAVATTQAADALPPAPDMMFLLRGRNAVGTPGAFKKWLGNSAPEPPDWNVLDGAAQTTWERIDETAVMAELMGRQAAARRLEELGREPGLTAEQRHLIKSLGRAYRTGVPISGVVSAEDERLLKSQGWFGELALGQGLPDTDPARRGPLESATRTTVGQVVAGVLILTAIFIGGALIIIAIVYLGTRRVRRAFVAPARDVVYLETFALYLLAFVGGGIVLGVALELAHARESAVWELLLLPVLGIAFWWPRVSGGAVRRRTRAEVMYELGWHRGRGVWREIAAGLLGYIGFLPLLVVCVMVTLVLGRAFGSGPIEHPIVPMLINGSPIELALLVVLAGGFAPVVEETFFRGALFNHLRGRWRWGAAAPMVGLIFALIHPQGWTAIPVLGGIGVMLCALREWRGSLIAPMTAHAVNNLSLMVIFLVEIR